MLAKARIAKVYAAEVAISVTNRAMELMSSLGYVRDSDIEKYWRDIKETQIWLGGAQLGRLDIARYFCNLQTI
jgi:alkylation response protein AidB-like acyl-CoA dehydrogenase